MKLNNKSIKFYPIYLAFLLSGSACTKFVQIPPPSTEIVGSTVFSDNSSAAAAMTGVYSNMMQGNGYLSSGSNSIGYLQGLAADELQNYFSYPIYQQFYTNALTSATSNGASNIYYWREIYNQIYAANSVIEGLSNNPAVSAATKQQITGEAKFMRSFFNFYAVNLYGDVPLVTTTDYQVNNTMKRSPAADVYHQIILDLEDAQKSLSDDFVTGAGITTTERTRPNKGAATALLARTFLYMGQWDSAAIEATAVINNSSQYSLVTDLNSVFLANSTEAIWQLQPTGSFNTLDGYYFILTSAPGSGRFPASLSPYVVQDFEPNDLRYTDWVDSIIVDTSTYFFPYKYKMGTNDPNDPVTEYTMVFRLAEQFLIRAEAEARLGQTASAAADLNVIRNRAGLLNTDATTGDALLTAIMHERRVELFTEWGHRWFDLARTNTINAVLGTPLNICAAKGGTWSPNWILVPLPLLETQINPNLKQNPGY